MAVRSYRGDKNHVLIPEQESLSCFAAQTATYSAGMDRTQPSQSIQEFPVKRSESRSPASGEILIELVPSGQVVRGFLLDVSPHGFAIRHYYEDFVPGQRVSVVYHWGRVQARLVWAEKRGGELAAGFRTD